jgi:hypothetical protein
MTVTMEEMSSEVSGMKQRVDGNESDLPIQKLKARYAELVGSPMYMPWPSMTTSPSNTRTSLTRMPF